MLSRLLSLVSFIRRPSYPSSVLALEAPKFMHFLHIVPETQEVEMVGLSHTSRSTFSCDDTKEVSREYLGPVTFYAGDGEDWVTFLDEISRRVITHLNKHSQLASKEDAGLLNVQLTDQAFRSVVRELLAQKKDRDPPRNAAQEYPIFVIQVDRPEPGFIKSLNLTSFPRVW